MNKQFFGNLQIRTLLFNRFKIVRALSASDVGGVYLCSDELNPGRSVVLKVLSTSARADELLSKNFEREVDVALNISHPNVVKAENFFQDENFTAFTMEYAEGGTLASRVSSKKRAAISEIIDIAEQICAGVEAIHQLGVIHRDLKPENILLDGQGRAKVGDFSISVSEVSTAQAADQQLVGTMNYLSPEYIQEGKIDKCLDIYAVGVIVYELITGRLPFQEGSLLESLLARVRYDAVAPRTLRSDCPVELSRITLKAMNRNPNKRYQSAAEMLLDLRALELALEEEARQRQAAIDSGKYTVPDSVAVGAL